MSDRYDEAVSAAVEAACEAVWTKVHAGLGPWPEGCPNPEGWRREEREALMPALAALDAAGLLATPDLIRTVRTEAVRGAARSLDFPHAPPAEQPTSWTEVARRLRQYADRIEHEGGTS